MFRAAWCCQVIPTLSRSSGQAWTADPFDARQGRRAAAGARRGGHERLRRRLSGHDPRFKAAALKRPIHILLSFDEETTCVGPLDAIARFGHDLPQARGGHRRRAHLNAGRRRAQERDDAYTRVRGFEIHSANLHHGRQRRHVACRLVVELERINETLRAEATHPAASIPGLFHRPCRVISGGTARNIVARDCDFHWEFRGLPGPLVRSISRDRLAIFVRTLMEPFIQRISRNGHRDDDRDRSAGTCARTRFRRGITRPSARPERTGRSPFPMLRRPGVSSARRADRAMRPRPHRRGAPARRIHRTRDQLRPASILCVASRGSFRLRGPPAFKPNEVGAVERTRTSTGCPTSTSS